VVTFVVDRTAFVSGNLAFQISGQGPYFGQAGWFAYLHAEKLPSAIERYQTEMKRILGVLETSLEGGKQWLVGDKCTYADLAFAHYNDLVDVFLGYEKGETLEGFPNVKAWHGRMTGKASWGKIKKMREDLVEKYP
jgi:glutathione S-transferase